MTRQMIERSDVSLSAVRRATQFLMLTSGRLQSDDTGSESE